MNELRITLPLPLLQTDLQRLRSRAAVPFGGTVRSTVDWLSQHPDSNSAMAAIRSAWRTSSLDLQAMADAIVDIRVWVFADRSYMGLEILRDDPTFPSAIQDAPMTEDSLRVAEARLGGKLPQVLRRLALAAPGLMLDRGRRSAIARPHYFSDPLADVRTWLKGLAKDRRYAKAARKVVEECLLPIAEDCLGNLIILCRDEQLYFFDHEEPLELLRCNIALDEFIHAYISDPECIWDNDWLLEKRPPPPPPRLESRNLMERVEAAINLLPMLSRIALLIRSLQRADLRTHIRLLPRAWRKHAEPVMSIVEACRQVAVTGTPITADDFGRCLAVLEEVTQLYFEADKPLDEPYVVGSFISSVERLVRACRLDEDARHSFEYALHCADVRVWNVAFDEWFGPTWEDARVLLELSKTGSTAPHGDTIPRSFFERPHWLNDDCHFELNPY